MTVLTLTIDQLELSDLNVRLDEEAANATSGIEASLLEDGLWYPLTVHPITVLPALRGGDRAPARQKWGVLDGGRRWRAIRRLVDAGHLPRDWPIDCLERDIDVSKITQMSLGVALLARELKPYEIAAAVAKMLHQGIPPEAIARKLGQEPAWVAQQLRLGDLAPELFTSFAANDISIEQARAFAATADHELQRAAFLHFASRHPSDRHPEKIRSWLKVGNRELARLLAFVGEDVYRAAGGAYELDLFADRADQRGRVADEGKLRELAENKMGFARQELRRQTGRSDLRFIAEPPKFQGYTDFGLQLHPDEAASGAISLPAGDVVALVEIRDGGDTRASWWWASRSAQQAAHKAARGTRKTTKSASVVTVAVADGAFVERYDGSGAQAARAAVKDEHGLTADGLHVVRSLRRELLRALLVSEADLPSDHPERSRGAGTLGRDYVIWALLRQELRPSERSTVTGARGLARSNTIDDEGQRDVVAPHLEQAEAHAVVERAKTRLLAEPFIAHADPADSLRLFVQADDDVKALAGAVLAGLALLRSANVPGWRIPAHDALANLAGGDGAGLLRGFWQPTPDFLGLFPRLKRLELAQPFETPARVKALAGAKDAEVTRAVAGVLAGQCWVHPLLSFPDQTVEVPSNFEAEAAE